jgi:hypothetical protein
MSTDSNIKRQIQCVRVLFFAISLKMLRLICEPASFARQDQRHSATGAPPKAAQPQCMLAPPENMATIAETKTSGRAN